MKKLLKALFTARGAMKNTGESLQYSDFTLKDKAIIEKVRPFTMTSVERIKALIDAVRYINAAGIDGSLVECGVWKGGSAMAMAEAMKDHSPRELILYDTFEGMTEPGQEDVSILGKEASAHLETEDKSDSVVWAFSPLEEVKNNLAQSDYPSKSIRFVRGPVEETLNEFVPEQIALLRLDTDWYESTKVELEKLYPRLQKGGILIIDDYGHWQGCKQAVDEYFMDKVPKVFFGRIDYTARIVVKP